MKTNWPIKKLGESPDEKTQSVLLDFYLNDLDVVIGRINDFRQSKILNELKEDIIKEDKVTQLDIEESENNFGYSADWHLILVEWLAKNDWANAIANFGGLLAFSKYFFSLWGRLKAKYKDKLRVGIASARLLALGTIFQKEDPEAQKFNHEILFEKEIVRQGGFGEKDFIFIVRRTQENKDPLIFFVHIDWLGAIKHFYEI